MNKNYIEYLMSDILGSNEASEAISEFVAEAFGVNGSQENKDDEWWERYDFIQDEKAGLLYELLDEAIKSAIIAWAKANEITME